MGLWTALPRPSPVIPVYLFIMSPVVTSQDPCQMRQYFQNSACKGDLGHWCRPLLFFIPFLTPQLWAVTQTVGLLSQLAPGKAEFSLPRAAALKALARGR